MERARLPAEEARRDAQGEDKDVSARKTVPGAGLFAAVVAREDPLRLLVETLDTLVEQPVEEGTICIGAVYQLSHAESFRLHATTREHDRDVLREARPEREHLAPAGQDRHRLLTLHELPE